MEVLQDLHASRGVEHGGGFVEDEYLGFGDQEASQGDALLLAARKSMGLAALEAFEADGSYSPGDPLAHLLPGDAEVLQAESDIVLDERCDETVLRVLEEDAEVLANLERFRCRIAARHQHAARIGLQEAVQKADQGGLATAVRAYHANVFSLAKVETHPRERWPSGAWVGEGYSLARDGEGPTGTGPFAWVLQGVGYSVV
jgi:hypothetical protein